jgi:hypothetical protein
VVEDRQVGAGRAGLAGGFLDFARSDERGAFDALAGLQDGAGDFRPGAANQGGQLFERLLGGVVRAAGRTSALPRPALDFKTDQQGAFRSRPRA